MKLHTKIFVGMCLGAIAGVAFQHFTEAVWVDSPGANGMIISHLDPECERAAWLAPLSMVADIFMRLLKMLIVPLILSSIVTGVTSVAGGKEFGRLGGKTLLYYMTTSLFAICGGLLVVNLFQPGTGAELVLSIPEQFDAGQGRSFADIFVRMVPPNIFEALTQNGQMLQVIVFALILGFFIAKSPEPHGPRIRGLSNLSLKS